MAITNINNLASSRLQNSKASSGQGSASVTASGEQSGAAKSDSVSLTSEARQLQQMHKSLSASTSGNESRVESLKKAIASGEYRVDSERVAKKMTAFEGQLDKLLG